MKSLPTQKTLGLQWQEKKLNKNQKNGAAENFAASNFFDAYIPKKAKQKNQRTKRISFIAGVDKAKTVCYTTTKLLLNTVP